MEALRPRLAAGIEVLEDGVVLSRDGLGFTINAGGHRPRELAQLLGRLDGERTLAEIAQDLPEVDGGEIRAFVRDLDRHGLIDDARRPPVRSGVDALLELEDLATDLLYRSIYKNVFWVGLMNTETRPPDNVLYGFVIENYHFLFREPYFDAPVLSYQGSTPARHLMNEFYVSEYGHDELLLKALNTVGITRDDLLETMPLTSTMALCNALAYWSSFDPLFFFSTIGVLEGKHSKIDSFVVALERLGMDPRFIAPIRHHSEINLKDEHGALSRRLFQHIGHVDEATMRRFRRQTHLFVELYDAFYSEVWNHYSAAPSLLRRVTDI